MKELQIFLLFVTIRLASVWLVQTSYVPDEYWQSLEVAHRISYGYGYLTWEWVLGLRSYLYPSLIALLYKLLEVVRLDYMEVVVGTVLYIQFIFIVLSNSVVDPSATYLSSIAQCVCRLAFLQLVGESQMGSV